MEEEAANELGDSNFHDFVLVTAAIPIVLPAETDVGLVEIKQATVGDRDAMGVAREIGQHLLGTGGARAAAEAIRSFFASPRLASRPAPATGAPRAHEDELRKWLTRGRFDHSSRAPASPADPPARPPRPAPPRAHEDELRKWLTRGDSIILREPPPRQPTRQLGPRDRRPLARTKMSYESG
jgi:hypothetical protein